MRAHLSVLLAATVVVLALALTAAVGGTPLSVVEGDAEVVPAAAPSPIPSHADAIEAETEPATRALLRRRLYEVIGDTALAPAGDIALVVVDEAGRTVVDRLGARPVMPASTQKLLTASAALIALGPDHRFRTTVRAAAPVGADGTLPGDLILRGGGDPTLATALFCLEIYPERPCTALDELANAVAEAGIVRVTGDVVGDGSIYGRPFTTPPGWTESYLRDLDARHISGLTVNAGLEVTIGPDGTVEPDLALDPAATAAARFTELLEVRGIVIDGVARSGDAPDPGRTIAAVASPPLVELLRYTVQTSDNHLADQIFHHLGRELSGEATWAGGAAAVRATLEPFGLDWGVSTLDDGSGLSRDNRVTARDLAALDRALAAGDHGALWADLMAVSGETGTLKGRLEGTPAAGRFRGKTGTLEDVVSLVGTAQGPGERSYHLAVIVTGPGGHDWRTGTRVFLDEVILRLVEDLYGCERVASTGATPAPEAAEGGWECALA